MKTRLGAWGPTSVTRAECNVDVQVVLELSHAQLPRLNVNLAPAQLVPRLDLGSAITATLFFITTRIMDALNAFLMMSVNRNISLHRRGQISANFVSQKRESAMENVDRLEGIVIARKLTAGRRIYALILATPADGATSAMDCQIQVDSTRTFVTREGQVQVILRHHFAWTIHALHAVSFLMQLASALLLEPITVKFA